MATINVTKYSGEQEQFDQNKLRNSLLRSGAEEWIVDKITDTVCNELYDGIPTKQIYKEAYRHLKTFSDRSLGRYKLKEAMLEFGPSGYPFEKFIGELFIHLGYKTQVGAIIEGKCISHEIDVIAEKDGTQLMAECKFHTTNGNKSDIKVPLYIHSRFRDIEENRHNLSGFLNKQIQGWVVTNTRFSADALQYGICAGLKMLSWDYPQGDSLRDLIDRLKLYPVTSIPSLSKKEKIKLLEMDVVLCKQINENEQILIQADITPAKIDNVLKEALAICNHSVNN